MPNDWQILHTSAYVCNEYATRLSIEHPWLGLFGPEKVNVLKLNLALDKIAH